MSDCSGLTIDSGRPDPVRLRAKHVIGHECIIIHRGQRSIFPLKKTLLRSLNKYPTNRTSEEMLSKAMH